MSDQLETISYTDETAKEIVERFCGHVHWLVRVRYTFKVLFEDEQPSCQTLIKKTASSFFDDLNRILREYLLLECAKITDRPTTYGDTNFTVDYLVQNICWPSDKAILEKMASLPDGHKDILQELKSLQRIAQGFREDIKLARDKLLAHLDMSAVLSSKLLGVFTEGKDKTFFCALEKLCNITHEACFGTIYGEMLPITGGGGDVINLRKALEDALAFREALSKSSGQEKTDLLHLRLNVGREPKP